MIIIPAIDIHDGRCVRMARGASRPEVVYADDPAEIAVGWVRQGARWLHVIDLDGMVAGRPMQLDVVRPVAAVGVPIQLGGGFRTLDAIEAGLSVGVERVLLDGISPALAQQASRNFGERVACLLAVRNGRLAADAWPDTVAANPISRGKALVAAGILRFIYVDVARDGTLNGPDIPPLEAFSQAVAVPVIAAGGVGSQADLDALKRIGLEGVIVGRALYEGRLDLRRLTGERDRDSNPR